MQVNVNFTLDINAKNWEDNRADVNDPATVERISAAVRAHAEAVVRDLFYDQAWIDEHHPADHGAREDCSWCAEADGTK